MDEERSLASEYSYVGAAVGESLESGLNGSFVSPPPAVMNDVNVLFKRALATVDESYRKGPLNPKDAVYYSMMAGILRVVEPECSNTESITKRLKELYSVLENSINLSFVEEDDAKSLIHICDKIVEMGEGYRYQEYVRDIS